MTREYCLRARVRVTYKLVSSDMTIRQRALSLLNGLVSKKNLAEIVRKLVEHAHAAEVLMTSDDTPTPAAAPVDAGAVVAGGAPSGPVRSYADDLIHKIVELCSMDSFAHLTDFEWYIAALVELTRVRGMASGNLVAVRADACACADTGSVCV
jgi:AP-3 complex subunit delta-1